ncbi:hypothetical protein [Yersinia canariae]|nr:hypothetical protein [Yersinia canariae]
MIDIGVKYAIHPTILSRFSACFPSNAPDISLFLLVLVSIKWHLSKKTFY